MQPDQFNIAVIEPGSSLEVNLTGLRIYSLFQNTTDSKSIDGSVTIYENGEEVTLSEPSLFAGVGDMEYPDGIIFTTMGWIKPPNNTQMNFVSDSNLSIFIVDQNQVSEEAFTQPAVLSSCFALVVSVCLLPLSVIMYFRQKKHAPKSSNVTLKTSDGRQISLAMQGLTNSGAVLTTEQIYALARLQERAGPDGKITIDFKVPSDIQSEMTPPPFSDRPDSLVESTKPSEETTSQDMGSETPSEVETESSIQAEEQKSSWKDWDEG
jgi:hypothetical protein